MTEEDSSEFVMLDLRDKLTFVREARLIGGRDAGLRAWRLVNLPDVFAGRLPMVPREVSDRSVDSWLECGVEFADGRERASDLYSAYRDWARPKFAEIVTPKVFSQCLQAKGFERKASNGMWYLGLRIVTSH